MADILTKVLDVVIAFLFDLGDEAIAFLFQQLQKLNIPDSYFTALVDIKNQINYFIALSELIAMLTALFGTFVLVMGYKAFRTILPG